MIVVNFAHPLTAEQREQAAALAGRPVERVIDVPTHFDDAAPFAPHVAALVAAAGLTAEEWQTLPLLVNLPSYGPIVAVLLAYLHGLSGHFPAVLRLRPAADSLPMGFDVAEVLSLDQVRTAGRAVRRERGRE